MHPTTLSPDVNHFPLHIASSLGLTFPQLAVIGNLDILTKAKAPIIGLFCSRDCSGSLILPALDHVSALREAGSTVISGFHSEMEQECLKLLLRGSQPIIIAPARSIENMRLPANWKKALAGNRLLVISPFEKAHRRVTAPLANQRNELVAILSDEIFLIHSKPGSETRELVQRLMKSGKKVYTIDSPANYDLIKAGIDSLK